MVAPVIGPVVRPVRDYYYVDKGGVRRLKRRVERTTYRQARPYNLNLPTSMLDQDSDIDKVESWANVIWWSHPVQANAYNDAYRRLVNGLGESAGMAINLAQYKESMGMMTARLVQIYNFTRHLKRLEFARAADDLNISRKRIRHLTLRKGAKDLGNNFLEFHFGWSPLVSDIYSCVDILQKPIPPSRISGSGTGHAKASSPPAVPWWNGKGVSRTFDVKVRLGAEISVSNPNLWLANRLGLINPGAVIWDAIPFSFVVDWFVNVSQFLGSFTEFAGANLSNSYNSVFWRSTYEERWGSPTVGVNGVTARGKVTSFRRSYGLGSGPLLRVKKPWQVSATRGATAISLLLQQLR